MALACKGLFIIGAKRTPFCRFGGTLRDTPAGHAFAAAATDAIRTSNLDPALIENTVVGNVHYLSQCDGGKTPRYCGLYSGVPVDRPALGVNKACGSGLQAVITGALDILTGVGKVCLTGGTEVMSSLPHLVKNARFGTTLGNSYQVEDYIQNQFPDSYTGTTMEQMAEDVAAKYLISRRDADEMAMQSHLRWKKANDSNAFVNEITKMMIKDVVLDRDQLPNAEINLETLSGLPATVQRGTVITTGNSSINETFASQALMSASALNIDPRKVNVSGGAVAMGNPVGATGARIMVHLVHELRRRGVRRGIAASSCGGGQGVAALLEAL